MTTRLLPVVALALILILSGCAIENDSSPALVREEMSENLTEQTAQETRNPEQTITKTIANEEPAQEPELTIEEKAWLQRIENAFAPSLCPQIKKQEYPGSSYKGPLIDTHFHIPNIPDSNPRDDGDEAEEYAENTHPILGRDVTITNIVCTLEHEGTDKVFAFFPAYPEIPKQMVEVVHKTMQRYPEKFVPFIMPPNHDDSVDGSPTVGAAALRDMLKIYPGLFRGYGEIGLYERQEGSAELPPDSPLLQEIYPVVRENKLVIYFHPGDGHDDNLARALRENPDITFIVHGDQIQPHILDLMDEHPNIYFTMNDLYGDVWLLRQEVTKEEFMKHFDDVEFLIQKDLAMYKSMIETHPDRFMWGTDRSDAVWNYDLDVGQQLAKYGRAFIGRLDPAVQEKFAYKNARRVFGESE